MSADANSHAMAVDKLERRFGSFVAVDQVSFQVSKGEVFGFLARIIQKRGNSWTSKGI